MSDDQPRQTPADIDEWVEDIPSSHFHLFEMPAVNVNAFQVLSSDGIMRLVLAESFGDKGPMMTRAAVTLQVPHAVRLIEALARAVDRLDPGSGPSFQEISTITGSNDMHDLAHKVTDKLIADSMNNHGGLGIEQTLEVIECYLQMAFTMGVRSAGTAPEGAVH